MSDRPTTEPRTEAGRATLRRWGHYRHPGMTPPVEIWADLKDDILAIEAEAPTAQRSSRERAAEDALRGTFDIRTDKGLHQSRWLDAALAEAAQGAAPLSLVAGDGTTMTVEDAKALIEQTIRAASDRASARADALPSAEALAEALTQIRGAHNGEDGYGEGPPCDWCVLAARQAREALARLSRPSDERQDMAEANREMEADLWNSDR